MCKKFNMNVNPDLRHHMASLGHNELMNKQNFQQITHNMLQYPMETLTRKFQVVHPWYPSQGNSKSALCFYLTDSRKIWMQF